MKHEFKNSSQVVSAEIDLSEGFDGRGSMTVTFKGGAKYVYFDVPNDTFELFTKAESAGKFMNASVKPFFKYAKVQS